MVASTVRLPDGQTFSVLPVFDGLFFQSAALNPHHNPFPVGWTVVLHTADEAAPAPGPTDTARTHSFRAPTLQRDSLFISSISTPSSSDFEPAASPTRQIAMMLWVTLYWYFHQPAPGRLLAPTTASQTTPVDGRPRGDWRIGIRHDGVLRGRNLLPKLERMGLVATLEPAVDPAAGWDRLYVSQGMFWQIPASLFLFTLQPVARAPGASRPGSPAASRPVSPTIADAEETTATAAAAAAVPTVPDGPFSSSSHLPTHYPPGPLRYTLTGNIRHPARPKPPSMGEVFYSRFVPSANQYLSLRVASSSPRPVPYRGPVGPGPLAADAAAQAAALTAMSDTELLQRWMASPRVSKFWGHWVADFLTAGLASQNSFPVIALWDGVPFGYFEIYWVKEDVLGQYMGSPAADFDRGLHVFIGEEWARGRVQQWLSSVVHWILLSDNRTMSVLIEPRVDNVRFIQHLQTGGFNKQREVTFPHKQSWLGRLDRDGWPGPAL